MKRAALLLILTACGGRAFEAGTQDTIKEPIPGDDSGIDSEQPPNDAGIDTGVQDSGTEDSSARDSGVQDSGHHDAACAVTTAPALCDGFSPFNWPTNFCGLQGPAGNGIVRILNTPAACDNDCAYTCACIGSNYPFTEDSGYSCTTLDGGGISIVYP